MDSTIMLIGENFLLIVVTAIYAGLTYRIAKANEKSVAVMKEQAEAFYRPYITVTHELAYESHIRLLIKNTGKTNAQNLKLVIDKSFYQNGWDNEQYNIAKLPAFTNVIQSFSPDGQIMLSLVPGAALDEATPDDPKTPTVFKITASYSFAGKTVTEPTTIDLRPYRNTSRDSDPLEKEVSKLREVLTEMKDLLSKKLDLE